MFYEINGLLENLQKTLVVNTIAGETYAFRYRVKNIFGFSSYSPVSIFKSAKAPNTPTSLVTSIVGKSVLI